MRYLNRLSSIRANSVAAFAGVGLLVAAGLGVFQGAGIAAEKAVAIPPPAIDEKPGGHLEKAVFAGGCFWGVQGVFQHVNGVTSAVSGYAGGDRTTAEYGMVSSGRTGHAESVRITYDPGKVSFGKLMQIYFSVAHDPTQLNR
jgi:peptide-methionine (S)-S-oxide reductase